MIDLTDALIILMFVMGLLLGASQRLVRVLMSTLIAIFALIATPAIYGEIGRFISALLMAPRFTADGLGFLLTALFFISVLELILRRSFKETFLPSLGILDQILGALVGLAWALMAASAALMPLIYVGSVSSSSRLISLLQALFRPFGMIVLRLLYPSGFSPLLDQFIG